jgi:hypothetical protein
MSRSVSPSTELSARERSFANETKGVNIIPFAIMCGGWIVPLLKFWSYVFGFMRPAGYPAGELAPPLAAVAVVFLACLTPWWLPASYYAVRRFEQSGRLYEILGVRWFRNFVPDGDLANRWRRVRIVTNRHLAAAFVERTKLSEKSHLVLLLIGVATCIYAWQIGWRGWAIYLAVANILVHSYPILLQRYTRARLQRILAARP